MSFTPKTDGLQLLQGCSAPWLSTTSQILGVTIWDQGTNDGIGVAIQGWL